MVLFALAYVAGVLTIVSPCILPVLPFVFARADRPFVRSGLPLLAGMAVTFVVFAGLATVAGNWVVSANDAGRIIAMVVLAGFGLALAFPAVGDRLTRPLVRWGSAPAPGRSGGDGVWASVLLGAATGLLWAPCAGPVLGLILTGAALGGAGVNTALLLVGYAAGAATSLAVALLAGGRVLAAMKRSLHTSERLRRVLGVGVLVSVLAITLGWDTGVLASISKGSTTTLEQGLIDRSGIDGQQPKKAPSLTGATGWLNTAPLTPDALRGKVVLVDFWTYSCVNCLRTLPYVRAWADRYRDDGLVVVGVHSPEFAFERDPANVRKAVADLRVDYPVALDNNFAIWRAFDNQYWPAHYLIDARGRLRYQHFGEGDYAETEHMIRRVLSESGDMVMRDGVTVSTRGTSLAADDTSLKSPETYLGYGRAQNFASPGGLIHDKPHVYSVGALPLNRWGLSGSWTVGEQSSTVAAARARVSFRFHARDVNLVLGRAGPEVSGRFRVTVDGRPPGSAHGMDVTAQGTGEVTGQRLYQVIRQRSKIADRTITVEFLAPGVQAYTFTFG